MRELEIANLNNARQRDGLFIDVFGIRGGAGFARDHLDAVGRFDRVEVRNVEAIEEPAAPCAVVGIAAMEYRKMHRINAVLDEIKPVVVVVASGFDISLIALFDQRSEEHTSE